MESKTLRQQFQTLQEQQQKKLLKRKQRQEEKNKKESNGKTEGRQGSQPESTLGISDDLGLTLSDPITNDVLYDEELNRHLTEQIRELKDESGRLYKLLSERDYEIRKLKRQRDDDRQAIAGTGVASDTAATKIVELSKKNRELTAELESEKTKGKQLLRKVRDAEKEMHLMAQSQDGMVNTSGSNKQLTMHRTMDENEKDKMISATVAELKSTQDKLSQVTNKMSDYRNQANTLKQELKIAHKVLSSEVGDGVNVQGLLNAPSGWRGRAQQILLLQNKVSDLKSQVDALKETSLEDQFMTMEIADGDAMSVTSASLTNRSVKSGSMDEKQRQRIRKLEKEKRETKERASEDLKVLEEEYSKLKGKWDASKARNKVLSNDVKTLKQQLSTLNDKGKHDNELIEALLKQQSHLKDLLDESFDKNKEVKAKQEEADKMLQQNNQQESNLIEQLKHIVSEKEQKMHQLEQEIREIKNRQQQSTQVNGFMEHSIPHTVHLPPTGSDRPLTVVSITDRPSSGDRHSGMSYNSPTPPPGSRNSGRANSRQDSKTISRHNLDSPGMNGRTSSRGNRPESTGSVRGGVASAQLDDLTRQLYEYKATSQAAEVERDKLLELVQILQQRMDGISSESSEFQAQLQQLKQQNVMLEKQLGRTQMADGKVSGKGARKQNAPIKTVHYSIKSDEALLKEDLPTTRDNLDELQTRLILQLDENHALKAALQSSMKAKEEDLRLYHEMMKQTKQVFLQGLRQFKQANQNS